MAAILEELQRINRAVVEQFSFLGEFPNQVVALIDQGRPPAIERYFDDGKFFADLARRVAIPTESQTPARAAALGEYLENETAEPS